MESFGPKIGVSCIEREELEKVVLEAVDLGLVEVDIQNGEFVLVTELRQFAQQLDVYNAYLESEALKAIEDKEWKLV